jgi:hypothetical protein
MDAVPFYTMLCPGAFDGWEPDPRKGGHYISLARLIKW